MHSSSLHYASQFSIIEYILCINMDPLSLVSGMLKMRKDTFHLCSSGINSFLMYNFTLLLMELIFHGGV